MKNDFNFRGYADYFNANNQNLAHNLNPSLEEGNNFPEPSNEGETLPNAENQEHPSEELLLSTAQMPSYLSNWYQNGYREALDAPQTPPYTVPKVKVNGRVKKILKQSLQIFTVAILLIAAVSVGGFVFLDRKINLQSTNATLQDMSASLVQTSAKGLSADALSPIVPEVQAKTTSQVLNASANTNVALDSNAPVKQDSDQDGLSDEVEEKLATNPYNADSDGDGYSDGMEVKNGYDPLTPAAVHASANYDSNSVVAGTSTNSSCKAGSTTTATGSCSTKSAASASTTPATSTTDATTPNFSNLSSTDLTALQNFGLSDADINKATSGAATDADRIAMQQKVLSSSQVKDSLTSVFTDVPKAPLPVIDESELNIFNSEKQADVEAYLKSVNTIFSNNFVSLKDLSSDVIRDHVLNNDYTEVNKANQSLSKAYADLKAQKVPSAALAVHKAFLTLLKVYTDVTDVNTINSQTDNKAVASNIIAQMKSFSDLQTNLTKALQDLSTKFGL